MTTAKPNLPLYEDGSDYAYLTVAHPTSPSRGDTVRCGAYIFRADGDEDSDGLTLCYIGRRRATVTVQNNSGAAVNDGTSHIVYYNDTAVNGNHLVLSSTGANGIAGFGTNRSGSNVASGTADANEFQMDVLFIPTGAT